MPTYYFDLRDGIPIRDRVGHQCADDEEAIFHGVFIAQRIDMERPEHADQGHHIAVINEDGKEIYLAAITSAGHTDDDTIE